MTELKKEVEEIKTILLEQKEKPFKLPWGARLSKGKLKKGFITVMVINENKSVDFVKKPLEDSVIEIEGVKHAVAAKDVFSYKGKPIIIQPQKKLNPYNPLSRKNETYGQKYIMAKMMQDTIKPKKSMGGLIWWIIGIIVGGYFLLSYLKGGG